MKVEQETFTDIDIQNAISSFIKYGEDTYRPQKKDGEMGQRGYFSGPGWAARCLRYHLRQLKKNTKLSGSSLAYVLCHFISKYW